MKTAIGLLLVSPFSQRDHERFGIETLQRHFDVYVFDLTAWVFPHVWKNLAQVVHPFEGYRSITGFDDFNRTLDATRCEIFIDIMSPGRKPDRIRRELRRRSIPRVVLSSGPLPPLPPKSLFQQLQLLKYRTHKTRVLVRWFLKYASRLVRRTTRANIAIMSGTASLNQPDLHGCRHIWAHTLDYDVYLKTRSSRPGNAGRYVVYTDEDCAFHSDFAHDYMKPLVNADNFYPALMKYFGNLEAATGLEVVIAAHPRSRWDLRPQYLDGRVPVTGKTAELISGARLVFAHASTSISFAVLYRVPLAFLTSDEMNDSLYREEVLVRSSLFRCPLINIDHVRPEDLDLSVLERTHPASYDEYRESYIKRSGSPEISLWEILTADILGRRQADALQAGSAEKVRHVA